jgi:hypothetical protein
MREDKQKIKMNPKDHSRLQAIDWTIIGVVFLAGWALAVVVGLNLPKIVDMMKGWIE